MKNKKIIIAIIAAVLIAASVITAVILNNRPDKNKITTSVPSEVSSEESEPIVSEVADNGIKLSVSSPESSNITVTDPTFTFLGTSDPAEPLILNNKEIERNTDGSFSFTTELTVGKNTFSFVHKGETKTYTIRYRYVIIKTYSPSTAQTYRSGSTIVVNVTARKDSSVKAAFNGKTIALTPVNNASDDKSEFISYNGVFTLPSNNTENLNLGKIKFTATHSGKTETFSSGNITCKKTDIMVDYDPNATPSGGKYINVGSGYIAEIIQYQAETFDGNVSASSLKNGAVDWSRPTNNYLPKGTLDYCSTSYVTYQDIEYVTLRAGYRVYNKRVDSPYHEKNPVVRQYVGTLPDHNEIGISEFKNDGSHTVLTLDTLWKAPFYFDILPQSYKNPSTQDYRVDNVTANYIDITFCYATVFKGEINLPQNPLFKSAKVIQNKSSNGNTRDYTLRLYLRKQGAFYGWDAYYNSNNQLCFEFLNPKEVKSSSNKYGVNLNGAKILIDVGHGGIDPGAGGPNPSKHSEAIQNLVLANKIKTELEKAGAKVYMTRTSNTTSSADTKIKMLKQIKPDFCVAVHHNSSNKASPNGFSSHYFNAFSKKAAEYIYDATRNTGNSIYKSHELKWHYYYMARVTNCPVVLTENGFMSNSFDYNNIINDAKNNQKAEAIVKGIVEYFKVNSYTPPPVEEPEPSEPDIPSESEPSAPETSSPEESSPESSLPESSNPDASSSDNQESDNDDSDSSDGNSSKSDTSEENTSS